MVVNALLLFLLTLICFIGTVVAVIFMILAFANAKENKYIWLSSFICLFIALVFCIVLFVKKAVNKVEDYAKILKNQIEQSTIQYSDSVSYSNIPLQQNNLFADTLNCSNNSGKNLQEYQIAFLVKTPMLQSPKVL